MNYRFNTAGIIFKIRYQDLYLDPRHQLSDLNDRSCKMPGTPILKVIPCNRSDNDILQVKRLNSFSDLCRLHMIYRTRLTTFHCTKTATPRTDIAQYHKSRSAFFKAFTHIRAVRFFTNSVKASSPHKVFHLFNCLFIRDLLTEPWREFFYTWDCLFFFRIYLYHYIQPESCFFKVGCLSLFSCEALCFPLNLYNQL